MICNIEEPGWQKKNYNQKHSSNLRFLIKKNQITNTKSYQIFCRKDIIPFKDSKNFQKAFTLEV